MFHGLRGQHAVLFILEFTVQLSGQALTNGQHLVQSADSIRRSRQFQEESNAGKGLVFHGIQIERARLHRVGHGELQLIGTLHAHMPVENIHAAVAQARFQQHAQQGTAFERRATVRNQVHHNHFQHGLGLTGRLGCRPGLYPRFLARRLTR